jgi:hypothetical protein
LGTGAATGAKGVAHALAAPVRGKSSLKVAALQAPNQIVAEGKLSSVHGAESDERTNAYDAWGNRLVRTDAWNTNPGELIGEGAVTVATFAVPGGGLIKAGKGAEGLATAANAPQVLRVGDVKLSAVPKGAIGTPTVTGKGLEYGIPAGTPELDPRVAGIRIMDPVATGKYQYPKGYAVYMNKSGQTINPLDGETIANSHPLAHISLR